MARISGGPMLIRNEEDYKDDKLKVLEGLNTRSIKGINQSEARVTAQNKARRQELVEGGPTFIRNEED